MKPAPALQQKSQTNLPAPNIIDQIADALEASTVELENLKFGRVEVEIRDGIVYKVLISHSILVKNGAPK